MTIQEYISKLNTLYVTGNAREHSYRGDLQVLLMEILPDILVTNEPARVACGAPDYVLTRKDVPVGYIEAKDIGVDLNAKILKEQFDRYKAGLSNLIFTDYLDFHFYKDGVLTTTIAIGKVDGGKIVALPENFDHFTQLIKNFSLMVSQTIKSPTKLAEMMAGKAKLMADVIEKSVNNDDEHSRFSALGAQLQSFKHMLIHDITTKSFADIYAQTIAYGMFAARYHDPTLPTFSRQEAATLIPKSNPFLRKLFQDIAGYDLDERLVWIVDELVQIFLATDVADIMKNFGKSTKQEDPVVHFYETFLAAYNPALRKARGVWYTPQPVVNFIVRAVDDILKAEFGLKDGLADTSKIKIKKKDVTKATADKRSKLKEVEQEVEVHRVQILDPATGTGTFLAEVVRHIHKKFEGQQGIWSKYVTNDLIPRLNGFELLMASYAMAHLKMDMLLTETGYKPTSNDEKRLRIFLTNSLEEAHPDSTTLFSSWLSDEADQANAIKRNTPVMVVIGNPPYSVSSTNKSKWIEDLLVDYKKNLNERNIQPLSDDYIKFIRFGQHYIDKNGEGILAYISNNSFIDGIIHRQMRKSLLESFDKIYILDLHGNSKKQEVSPDGTPDQNVFDIMQGVSINLFVKTAKAKVGEQGIVNHFDLYGKRENKYKFLAENNLQTIAWNSLTIHPEAFYFSLKNFDNSVEYENGFEINKLFVINSSGIKTHRDDFVIDTELNPLENRILEFFNHQISDVDVAAKYNLKDNRDWKIKSARIEGVFDRKKITKINYRPFDDRFCYYDSNLIDFGREKVMRHFLNGRNYGICTLRQSRNGEQGTYWISQNIVGKDAISSLDTCTTFPLYLYHETSTQQTIEKHERVPNLNLEIVIQIEEKLKLAFIPEEDMVVDLAEGFTGTFTPIDLLDYIYAVLHSPAYREKYKEFLKIDFPRVPYPEDAESFWKLVELGGQLRQLHLLEADNIDNRITQYPEDGDNIVTKPVYKDGSVYINDTQYFKGVPETVWNFYIGGYQPAQKWLKDRKGRALSYEDILHYQRIVVSLNETGRIMREIDLVRDN